MHTAIYIYSVIAPRSVQSSAFNKEDEKKWKAYLDKAFQTALNQVRAPLAHTVEEILTDNILKR